MPLIVVMFTPAVSACRRDEGASWKYEVRTSTWFTPPKVDVRRLSFNEARRPLVGSRT